MGIFNTSQFELQKHRTATGEYWHPVFWTPYERLPSFEESPDWYPLRLAAFKLETESYYLGDGQPAQHELPLLRRYQSGDKTAIKDWVPQLGPSGHGWFILTIQDSDLGPFVTWAREKTDEKEVNP